MEINIEPIPLSELLKEDEEILNKMLHSFTCGVNKSIERFLHKRAINQEKEDKARTTLMVDRKTGQVVGYFTVLIEGFYFTRASGKNRKKIAGDKHAESFLCILIGKIGRSDAYKGKVSGDDILEAAIYNCSIIKSLTATKVVCVEYEDIPELKEFYENNDFTLLQRNEDNNLNISFLKI